MGKIQRLLSVNWIQFLYYNFLCRNVIREKGKYVLPYRGTKIELKRDAKIILKANLHLGGNRYPNSNAECWLRLRSGATMIVTGSVKLMYNGTIEVHKNAKLEMGESCVQSGAVIICAHKIKIGNGCLFARMSYLSDSDHHQILNEDGAILNYPRETAVGNHVWVGVKATILKGAQVHDGCVIAAHAVAGGEIPKQSLVRCASAKPISDVYWSTEGFGEI